MAFGDVTVTEVVNLFGGQSADGGSTFDVFGGKIASGAIQAQLDIAEDWLDELLDGANKAKTLANQALRTVAAYRTLMIVTGQMLQRGFSYSIGKLSVDKRSFPAFMKDLIGTYHQDSLSIIRQLLPMGHTIDQSDLSFVNPILDEETGIPFIGIDRGLS